MNNEVSLVADKTSVLSGEAAQRLVSGLGLARQDHETSNNNHHHAGNAGQSRRNPENEHIPRSYESEIAILERGYD